MVSHPSSWLSPSRTLRCSLARLVTIVGYRSWCISSGNLSSRLISPRLCNLPLPSRRMMPRLSAFCNFRLCTSDYAFTYAVALNDAKAPLSAILIMHFYAVALNDVNIYVEYFVRLHTLNNKYMHFLYAAAI